MTVATHHTGYLRHVCSTSDELRKTIALAIRRIKKSGVEFDAIACRGTSGLAIAPIICYKLNKQLIIVRKPKEDESSHTSEKVEGLPKEGVKYIVVDDLISSGNTMRAIIDTITARGKDVPPTEHPVTHSCEGAYLYNQHHTKVLDKQRLNEIIDD